MINAGSCSFLECIVFNCALLALRQLREDYNFKTDSNFERFHLVRANILSFLQIQRLCRRNYIRST